jgi:hypothetical protein
MEKILNEHKEELKALRKENDELKREMLKANNLIHHCSLLTENYRKIRYQKLK